MKIEAQEDDQITLPEVNLQGEQLPSSVTVAYEFSNQTLNVYVHPAQLEKIVQGVTFNVPRIIQQEVRSM